jgi:hypothetical protein
MGSPKPYGGLFFVQIKLGLMKMKNAMAKDAMERNSAF